MPKRYRDLFKKHATKYLRTSEFEIQKSLPWVVGRIIQHKGLVQNEAAVLLGISATNFGAFLRGRLKITQAFIENKNWRPILLTDDVPKNLKDLFEKYAATLPKDRWDSPKRRHLVAAWQREVGRVVRRVRKNQGASMETFAKCVKIKGWSGDRRDWSSIEKGEKFDRDVFLQVTSELLRRIKTLSPDDRYYLMRMQKGPRTHLLRGRRTRKAEL